MLPGSGTDRPLLRRAGGAAYHGRPVIVVREFPFDAAHFLPNHPGRCRNMHGHTYRLQVWCEGPIDAESGMVLDFQDIKDVVKARVLDLVDHTLLNDRIENPTAERIAAWIWDQLADTDLPLKEIRLYETPTCFVVHRPAETPAPNTGS